MIASDLLTTTLLCCTCYSKERLWIIAACANEGIFKFCPIFITAPLQLLHDSYRLNMMGAGASKDDLS